MIILKYHQHNTAQGYIFLTFDEIL